MKYRRAAAIILTIVGFFLPAFMITKVSLNLPIVLGGSIIYALYFYLVGRLYGLDEKGNMPLPPTNAASASSPSISYPSCSALPSAKAAAEAAAPACAAAPAAPTISCPSCDAPPSIKAAKEASAPACTVPTTPEQAAAILRQKIIASLQRQPSTTFELARLLWDDAKACTGSMTGMYPSAAQWVDGIWFRLDLKTRKLYAKMSSYPNAFGASREDSCSVSAEEFHRLALEYQLNADLLPLQTSEDWAALFDDDLNNAIAAADTELSRREEAHRKKNAVQIPAIFADRTPNMDIAEITYTLTQLYTITRIHLVNKGRCYHVHFESLSPLSGAHKEQRFNLTCADGAWIEAQVEAALNNPDTSTWQSLAGGDRMKLVIRRKHGKSGAQHSGTPITKYTDLMDIIVKMAQYNYTQK